MRPNARMMSASNLEVHREVRPLPVPQDPEALEVGALLLHLGAGIIPAGAAEGARIGARARRSDALLDLVLDGQAVAVPAGDVRAVEAAHGRGLTTMSLSTLLSRCPMWISPLA